MKRRTSIVVSLVALMALFLALPLQAQYTTNTYDGTTTFKVTQTLSTGDCKFNPGSPNPDLTPYMVPKGAHALVHYVVWQGNDTFSEQWLTIDQEKRNVSEFKNKRFFGRHEIYVVAIHSNANSNADITYQIEVKEKIPQWAASLGNLFGLARECRYGTMHLTNLPVPSDIIIKAEWSAAAVNIAAPGAGGRGSPPSPPGEDQRGAALRENNPPVPSPVNPDAAVGALAVAPPTGTEQKKLTFSATFDNESKYWADLSIGVPVNSYSLSQYEIADGVLRRKEASRQSAYGFINVFFGRQDTKSDSWLQRPHALLGLPLKGKSLQHPAAALGIGTKKWGVKVDLFGGLVFNRTLVPDAAGGTATSVRWVRKGLFGFNIPLHQFISTYEKKK